MPDLYCPQCHSDCGVEACPTTAEGACQRCGKVPVAWAEREKEWLWCNAHNKWHDTPCAEDAKQHCCAAA